MTDHRYSDAEGVGLGWVSFFDPDALAVLLGMPAGARPLDEVLFENAWKVGAGGTAPSY